MRLMWLRLKNNCSPSNEWPVCLPLIWYSPSRSSSSAVLTPCSISFWQSSNGLTLSSSMLSTSCSRAFSLSVSSRLTAVCTSWKCRCRASRVWLALPRTWTHTHIQTTSDFRTGILLRMLMKLHHVAQENDLQLCSIRVNEKVWIFSSHCSLESHDYSILCWFAAQETFLTIINVENSSASLNIFLWKFLRIILMIQKFKSIYFKTEIFCNIIVNFDQFNAFLKNESINWSHVSAKTLGYVQHIFF